MPVVSMNETSWDDSRAMLSHGSLANMRQSNHISKDDAGVSYFFQRPQESNDPSNYSNKKWAVGDDSVLDQVSKEIFIIRLVIGANINAACYGKMLTQICQVQNRN
jgi:hypothetical protein